MQLDSRHGSIEGVQRKAELKNRRKVEYNNNNNNNNYYTAFISRHASHQFGDANAHTNKDTQVKSITKNIQ